MMVGWPCWCSDSYSYTHGLVADDIRGCDLCHLRCLDRVEGASAHVTALRRANGVEAVVVGSHAEGSVGVRCPPWLRVNVVDEVASEWARQLFIRGELLRSGVLRWGRPFGSHRCSIV